jgi:hypothetical protein
VVENINHGLCVTNETLHNSSSEFPPPGGNTHKHNVMMARRNDATPFLPASQVDLTVQGTTLTHHFPSQLGLFAGLPAYREYLCRHHHWDSEVFNLIDWPSFDACSRTLSFLKRLSTVKWTHDLLPFQEQQHRFNQSSSPQCPSSCSASEDWRHFLRCAHPARLVIWRECSRTIAKTMDTWSIHPSLRRLVLYWLVRLSDDSPIPLDNLGDEYSMLRTTQEAIGDDSILFGYFAHEWVQLQERYLRARELPRGRNQAAGGIKAIALQLLEQCHECWLLHNIHLHGTDPQDT